MKPVIFYNRDQEYKFLNEISRLEDELAAAPELKKGDIAWKIAQLKDMYIKAWRVIQGGKKDDKVLPFKKHA